MHKYLSCLNDSNLYHQFKKEHHLHSQIVTPLVIELCMVKKIKNWKHETVRLKCPQLLWEYILYISILRKLAR